MKFQSRNSRASKLSERQVLEIRARYAEGRVSQGQLSREYQVGVITIGRIVRGETWQHLSTPDHVMSEGELKDSADRLMDLQEAMGHAKLVEVAEERGKGDAMVDELRKGPMDE